MLWNVYPTAKEQRCWNHRIVTALDKVPKTRQAHARLLLTQQRFRRLNAPELLNEVYHGAE